MKLRLSLVLIAATLFSTNVLSAAEWGDLKLKFVYDGTPPAPTPISVTKDVQTCGQFGLVGEELVVNPENKGIANVLVYMYTRTGPKPAIHPDYEATSDAKIVLDNLKCRFEPHVALVRTTQTLILKNSDPVGHNMNYTGFSNPPFNDLIPSGAQLEKKLTQADRLPATVTCSIHPWMNARVVAIETPYGAVSNKDGEVIIKNIPVGTWTFQLWQEQVGYVADVKQNGKATNWSRGRPEITIKPGVNDLGEIKFKYTPK